MTKIIIKLNGEDREIIKNITIADLVKELNLDLKKIAIEKDLEVIHPQDFDKTIIDEGSRIEIVHFIGGG